MLVLRAERLLGAMKQALEGGDAATGARMYAEAMDAIREARELAEREMAQ
jgi:hypothetical protein